MCYGHLHSNCNLAPYYLFHLSFYLLCVIYFCKHCVTETGQYSETYLIPLTLYPLTWKIWRARNNASRWQMGFNSAFKELDTSFQNKVYTKVPLSLTECIHSYRKILTISYKYLPKEQPFIYIRVTDNAIMLYFIQELVVFSGCISGSTYSSQID